MNDPQSGNSVSPAQAGAHEHMRSVGFSNPHGSPPSRGKRVFRFPARRPQTRLALSVTPQLIAKKASHMSLKIRLARGGSKKRPYYRIVIADSRAPRDGRFIEKVGHYNPLLAKDDDNRVGLNVERIKEWMGKGAKPTDRGARFMSEAGLVEWKAGNNPNKAKPGQKALDRIEERKEKEEARKAAEEEAKAAAAEAKAAAEEAPAEEATEEAEG